MDVELIAILGSGGATLVAVGAAWGNLRGSVRGINRRLDVANGDMATHEKRIDEHGERLARMEGPE